MTGVSSVQALDAGGDYVLALLANGTARGWGANSLGQLGDGTPTDRFTAVPVSGLTGASAISGGGLHSMARC